MQVSPDIELRPATSADIQAFYQQPLIRTIQAFTVYYKGELAGIAGMMQVGPELFVFSDAKAGLNAPKKAYWRTAKAMLKLFAELAGKRGLKTTPEPDLETAPRFLEHLGFSVIGRYGEDDLYQFQAASE